jgi:hypothetical protein
MPLHNRHNHPWFGAPPFGSVPPSRINEVPARATLRYHTKIAIDRAGSEPEAHSGVFHMPLYETRVAGGGVMGSEEAVRQRSYEIWVREGQPEGKSLDHWLRAKAELQAEHLKPRFRTFEYYMKLYRFEEWQRAVQPKPRISAPPQVRMATRIPHKDRPAAAA